MKKKIEKSKKFKFHIRVAFLGVSLPHWLVLGCFAIPIFKKKKKLNCSLKKTICLSNFADHPSEFSQF